MLLTHNQFCTAQEPLRHDKVDELYEVAARNLREHHGVPSMNNAAMLIKAMTLFKLRPNRLVKRGLAPAGLLAGPQARVPLGDDGNDNQDFAETVKISTTNMVNPMSTMECDEKELNDDFILVRDETTVIGNDQATSSKQHSGDDNMTARSNMPEWHKVINVALEAAGVKLSLRETRPLLNALGVLRCRLVGLGLVDGSILRVRPTQADAVDEIFEVAARNLRKNHGVHSMTPAKLKKTLALLTFPPRRLVKQGLAPAELLAGTKARASAGGGSNEDVSNVSFSADDVEPTTTEDNTKEWTYNCVPVGDDQAGDGKPENVFHAALVAADIELRPAEAVPLLRALGVKPCRLVKLNLVDPKTLKVFLAA